MYIEFKLPVDQGAAFAEFYNHILNQELNNWSDKYHVPYRVKLVKGKQRISFDDDNLYSFFVTTWNPKNKKFLQQLFQYSLIEPMNRV